jgi:NAD(P)-dependent dehydrogenase (short-subunit alcohol dehydrogenase family)
MDTFAQANHRLSVLVRRPERIAELTLKFPDCHFFSGDLSSENAAAAWVESAFATYGRIDCLINNAAVAGPGGRLHEVDFKEFQECLHVNFLMPAFLCQRVLKYFVEQGSGVIFNLSGGGAAYPRPRFAAYGAAKTALVRLTETLAKEYPDFQFYAISPGAMKTAMTDAVLKMDPGLIGEEYVEARKRFEAGGDDPQKAAELIRWLWENRPQHLNGRTISAVWDKYQTIPKYPDSAGWWTLRRVDEVCQKNLKLLS